MRIVTQTTTRYFPDDPKNKVFAVDVYVTVCKCYKVEAKDEKDAEAKVESELVDAGRGADDATYIHNLADRGFQDAEEYETRVSGEADSDGEIQYY